MSELFTESPIEPYKSSRTVYYPFVGHQFESPSKSGIEALHKILRRLEGIELPGKEHLEAYLRYLCRRNRRPRTLAINYTSIVTFLGMIKDKGKTSIEEITKRDVEAFIEHEQDRGLMITTIRTRLVCVYENLGQYQRAIEDFSEAIRLKPADVVEYSNAGNTYSGRGDAYSALGQHRLAIEDYTVRSLSI